MRSTVSITVYNGVLLTLLLCHHGYSQDPTANPTPAASLDSNTTESSKLVDQVLVRPIDKAVAPAYTMANYFLEVIIRPPRLAELDKNVNLSSLAEVQDSLQQDLKIWTSHFTGYLVCLVLGGLYIIGLVVAGFVICCCRCRGKCKKGPNDKKTTKYSRRICAVLLGLVWVLLMLGVTVMFLVSNLTYEQTQQNGLPKALGDSVSRLDSFLDLAKESYEKYFDMNVLPQVRDLNDTVENFPKHVQSDVLKSDISVLMSVLEKYVRNLNNTGENVLNIDGLVSQAQMDRNDLKLKLDELNANLTNDFTDCENDGNEDCKRILDISSKLLDVGLNLSSLPTVDFVANDFIQSLSGNNNIYVGHLLSQQELDKIGEAVMNSSQSLLDDLTTEITKATNKAEQFLKEAVGFMDEISLAEAMSTVNGTINPSITRYGGYWYYSTLSISSLVLLITTICALGLLFGACGKRKGEHHRCSKGQAATLLLVGLVMIFTFAWILMLIPAVLVPIGGIVHNDICENLLTTKDVESTKVVYDTLNHNFNLSFSLQDVYKRCENEESLYNALQLEVKDEKYDLSDILNANNYDVNLFLARLQNTTYQVGNLTIVNSILESNIGALVTATDSINLTSHQQVLQSEVLSESLVEFSDLLRDVNVTARGDQLQFYSDVFMQIHQVQYSKLLQSKGTLEMSIADIIAFKTNFDITNTVEHLKQAQTQVTSNDITNAVNNIVDNIQELFEELLSKAEAAYRNELAHCGTVANVISDGLDAICVRFLYPFNAFWFSLGCCLFLFILVIPINIILSDLYKKTEPYKKVQPSLDDPFSQDMRGAAMSDEFDQDATAQRDYSRDHDVQDYRRGYGQNWADSDARYPTRRTNHDEYNNLAYYNDYDDVTTRTEPYYRGDDTAYPRAHYDTRNRQTLYPDQHTARSEFRY